MWVGDEEDGSIVKFWEVKISWVAGFTVVVSDPVLGSVVACAFP